MFGINALANMMGSSASGGMLGGGYWGGHGGLGTPQSPTAYHSSLEAQIRAHEEAYERYARKLMEEGEVRPKRPENRRPDIDKMPLLQYLRARKDEWLGTEGSYEVTAPW